MAKQNSLEEIEIKLALVDILEPYGIGGNELIPFVEENLAILQFPLQERGTALYELADKIKKYYKKAVNERE